MDDYNFDVPDGIDLMVFEQGEKPSGSEMIDKERKDLTLVCQTTLSVPEGNRIFIRWRMSPVQMLLLFPQLSGVAADIILIAVRWMRDLLRTLKGVIGRIGAVLHFILHVGHFRRRRTIRSRRLCSGTNCFRRRC